MDQRLDSETLYKVRLYLGRWYSLNLLSSSRDGQLKGGENVSKDFIVVKEIR